MCANSKAIYPPPTNTISFRSSFSSKNPALSINSSSPLQVSEIQKNILQSKSNQLGGSIHNYHVQQAGAVGPYSSAQNNTFNQLNQQLPADTNFEELKEKLEQLRKAIAGEADLPEHYAAFAKIKKAEIALIKKNGSEVKTSLKAASKLIFNKGIDVGKEVLVAYIKSATGL